MLKIEVTKIPHRFDETKTMRPTIALMEEILSQLGYSGLWTITFNKQIRWKSDERFKLIRREGTSIRCRTKPGDNTTAWEILLAPPPGYLLDDITDNFRQVHPKKLFVPQPNRQKPIALPADLGQPGSFHLSTPEQTTCTWTVGERSCGQVGVEGVFHLVDDEIDYEHHHVACKKHKETSEWRELVENSQVHDPQNASDHAVTMLEAQREAKKIAEESARANLIVEQNARRQEIETLAISNLADAKRRVSEWLRDEVIDEPESKELHRLADLTWNANHKPEKKSAISISHFRHADLSEEPDAISKGLIAIAIAMNASGLVEAADAVKSLIKELDLESFPDSLKSASQLIEGMKEYRFLVSAKIDSAPGYALSKEGRIHLGDLQESMPLTLVKRLFQGKHISVTPKGSVNEIAEQWLAEQLESGPVPLSDLKERAKVVGITVSALHRARKSLDINSRRVGRNFVWEFLEEEEYFDEEELEETPPKVDQTAVIDKISSSGEQDRMLAVVARYQELQASIPEHDVLIDQVEGEKTEIEAIIARIRIRLETKLDILRELQKEVDALQAEIDQHQSKGNTLQGDIEELKKAKAAELEELEQLKSQLKAFLGKIV